MKRLVIVPLLFLVACGQSPEQVSGPEETVESRAGYNQHSNSNDWLLYGMLGYMLGSSNSSRNTTTYVQQPAPTAAPASPRAFQSDARRSEPSPSPSRSTPPASSYNSSSRSNSSSSYSSGSSSRSYSGGSSSYSSGGRR